MKMHVLKEGCFLVLLVSVIDVRGLFLSIDKMTKKVDDPNFVVACIDNSTYLPVKWYGPKRQELGPATRPAAHHHATGYMLTFSHPHRKSDSGKYTCETATEKRVFELKIEPQLEFVDTASIQTGEEGKDYVLKCQATGGTTVSWAVEGGGNIEQSIKFKVRDDGLLVRNVTRHDGKTYTCKAVQSSTGSVMDRKIHFRVRHKPTHPHPTKHMRQEVVYGYINGTVNLTCYVLANPPAEFEWKFKNSKERKVGTIISENKEISILQLRVNKTSDFGDYKCVATNKYGSYEEVFTLKEGKKPSAPSNVQVKEATSKEAIFEILGPNQNPDIEMHTGFKVLYRKVDEQDWRPKEFNFTQSNLYTLENLEGDTEYELQAATRSRAGVSDYFPSIRWKTSRGNVVHLTLTLLYGAGAVIFFQNFLAFW